MSEGDVRAAVRAKYGEAAMQVSAGGRAACCGGGATAEGCDPITRDLYGEEEQRLVPEAAVKASLGCGNPTALAELREGEVVLDLGSGGGMDVLLSAKRVGPSGKAYGVDMTDEMLELARRNQREAGIENVEFLKGDLESLPLEPETVDVVISNCVINLTGDKRAALAEAYRVLRPGGRFAVSDVVVRGEVPPEVRRSMELWVGCVAGALDEAEFERLLTDVGFEAVEIEATRVYRLEDAREFLAESGLDVDRIAAEVDGRFLAAFVRARKPAAGAG